MTCLAVSTGKALKSYSQICFVSSKQINRIVMLTSEKQLAQKLLGIVKRKLSFCACDGVDKTVRSSIFGDLYFGNYCSMLLLMLFLETIVNHISFENSAFTNILITRNYYVYSIKNFSSLGHTFPVHLLI